jgi:hypothetical protein
MSDRVVVIVVMAVATPAGLHAARVLRGPEAHRELRMMGFPMSEIAEVLADPERTTSTARPLSPGGSA